MASFVWTIELTDRLIELYEQRPCLYNTTIKDYFNRDIRSKALAEIVTDLGSTGWQYMHTAMYIYSIWSLMQYLEAQVKSKLKSIRAQYTRAVIWIRFGFWPDIKSTHDNFDQTFIDFDQTCNLMSTRKFVDPLMNVGLKFLVLVSWSSNCMHTLHFKADTWSRSRRS